MTTEPFHDPARKPGHPPEGAGALAGPAPTLDREHVLAIAGSAAAHMRSLVLDLDLIGSGVKCGAITPADAMAILRDSGLDQFALQLPAPPARSAPQKASP